MVPTKSSAPTPPHAIAEIVTAVFPEDERLWVLQAENVWFRPLLLNTVNGEWVNLLRVRKSGMLNRHRHPAPVHGYVLKGSWRYLEHDWIARAGMYVFEPPGEIHTLVVDEGVEEMVTLFHVCGALIYVDAQGAAVSYDDVHTKIEMCRRHFAAVGLGADYVKQFIR
jgi:2,4'-dihydroxyacetophenone dioxygenase